MVRVRHKIKELQPGIFSIWEAGVRMFVVVGESSALLYDTGMGHGDLRGSLREITSLPLTVLNSHGHRDHVDGNPAFAPCLIHADDYHRMPPEKQAYLQPVTGEPSFDLGGRRLRTLHLPGHTGGQLLLFEEATGTLFSSDSLMDYPINIGDFGALLPQYIVSLERIWQMHEQFTVIYPSHRTLPFPVADIALLLDFARGIADGSLEGQVLVRSYDGKRCRRYEQGKYTIDLEIEPC